MGTAEIVILDTLVLTKTLIGLSSGSDYIFKVRARNVYGYGPFSPEVTIRASDVPDTMETLSTMQILDYLVVTWAEPHNGGDSIDLYEIQLLTPQGNFVESTSCTGAYANGPSCTFQHDYLRNTYGFIAGDIF